MLTALVCFYLHWGKKGQTPAEVNRAGNLAKKRIKISHRQKRQLFLPGPPRKFTKRVSFPSAFRATRFPLAVSGPLRRGHLPERRPLRGAVLRGQEARPGHPVALKWVRKNGSAC